jgi:hypothetical protein
MPNDLYKKVVSEDAYKNKSDKPRKMSVPHSLNQYSMLKEMKKSVDKKSRKSKKLSEESEQAHPI